MTHVFWWVCSEISKETAARRITKFVKKVPAFMKLYDSRKIFVCYIKCILFDFLSVSWSDFFRRSAEKLSLNISNFNMLAQYSIYFAFLITFIWNLFCDFLIFFLFNNAIFSIFDILRRFFSISKRNLIHFQNFLLDFFNLIFMWVSV